MRAVFVLAYLLGYTGIAFYLGSTLKDLNAPNSLVALVIAYGLLCFLWPRVVAWGYNVHPKNS